MTQQTFGPYRPVVQAGNTYYVAGQVGVDPDTKQAAADVVAQAKQVFANLDNVLKTAGLSSTDVVKATVFLADIGDFAAVNEVYQEYFDAPRPARSCVGVAELPRVGGDNPILVEVEVVAYKAEANDA